MATITHNQAQTLTEHCRTFEEATGVPYERWRIIKSLLYAALIAGVAAAGLVFQSDPTLTVGLTIAAILVVFGTEIKEIEVANLLTITFRRDKRWQDQEQEDD